MNYAEKKKRIAGYKGKLEEWAGKIIESTSEIEVLKKEMKTKLQVIISPNLAHSEVSVLQKEALELKKDVVKAIKGLNMAIRMEKETKEKLLNLEKCM